jgi:hypothetical protein
MAANARLDAVEYAVKVQALKRLAREIGVSEALAVIAKAIDGTKDETATPRELAAARRHAHRAEVVDEIVRLEMDGRGRGAASIVAGRYAADRHDPIEVESLRRKFQRWRLLQKAGHISGCQPRS